MIRFFAHLFSALFHPFLMVTYGLLIALNFTSLKLLLLIQKALFVGGTFLLSALLPALAIGVMIAKKKISGYEVDKREERFPPYMVAILALLATLAFLTFISAPYWILGLIGGMVGALCVAVAINKYWKISVHGMGVGGIAGAIFAIIPLLNVNPLLLFLPALAVGGLVCSSRLILNRHTLGQVGGGFLLGFFLSVLGIFASYKLFYNL